MVARCATCLDEIEVNKFGGKQSFLGVRYDLIPPSAIHRVAATFHHGAEKYGDTNWHSIETNSHLNHALQHIYSYLKDGNASKEDDLAHAATRLLMALYIQERGVTPNRQDQYSTSPRTGRSVDLTNQFK